MTSFSGKLTLPYLLQQGLQRRLWQGKIIDVKLISERSAIIISSVGAELFDFNSQKTIWEIECPIESAVISFDNQFLVTSWQYKNYIWDLDRGKFLHQLKPSSSDRYITSNITFLPKNNIIAFVELYTDLIFYDLISRKYTKKITKSRGIQSITINSQYITFSRDLKLLAFLLEYNIVTIYNLESQTAIQSIKIVKEDIVDDFSLVFTPDCKYIIYAHGKTQNVYIYEIKSGECIQVLEKYTENIDNINVGYHSETIVITFSDDVTLFAIGNSDGKIRIWNFKNKEYIKTITISEVDDLFSIEAISFSQNNNYLATIDSTDMVKFWEIKSNQKLAEKQYTNYFYRPILSPDFKILATIDRQQIILWNLNSGELIKKLENDEYYNNIAFHSSGTKIVATSYDGTIQVWDIQSETQIFSLTDKSYLNAIINPNDRLIAVANKESSKAEIWDIQSKSCISIDKNSQFYISSNIAFSRDGQILLIEEFLKDAKDGFTYFSGTISLWDANSGKFLRRLTEIDAHGLIFSPNGNLIAGESNIYDAAILYDFNSGKQLQIFREENNYHNSEITCIAFSCDSKILASASYDLTIRLWDVATGKQIKLIEGHSNTIFEIFFIDCDLGEAEAQSDRTLVSISADRTIKFWQI